MLSFTFMMALVALKGRAQDADYMTLIKAAASGDQGPYVVMEDERLRASEENLPTSSFDPLVFRKFVDYPNDATRTDACVG